MTPPETAPNSEAFFLSSFVVAERFPASIKEDNNKIAIDLIFILLNYYLSNTSCNNHEKTTLQANYMPGQ
jgi:hypothetical protein